MINRLTESLQLLRKIKAGDKRALDQLFRRYYDRLLEIVRMKLGQEMRWKVQSSDVLQEVFIVALNNIEEFEPRPKANFLNWFAVKIEYKIRDMYDYFRAAKRNQCLEAPLGAMDPEQGSVFENLPGRDKTPSQILMAHEEVRKIQKAFDKLGKDQREVIVLRIFEGLSFNEIGQLQGRQPDAARMAFSRAMAKLTSLLEN